MFFQILLNKEYFYRSILINRKEYFFFVTDSINYKGEFLSRTLFQWETPNSTAQTSERGKNIIFNKERGINLHLFVRKYKEIDKKVQPYIYIGKGGVVKYEGEKPIIVEIELHNKIPENLYVEFTKKV